MIGHPLSAKDTLSLLRAVENLGAVVKRTQERWSVWGVGRGLKPRGNAINAGNSATALSMLASISTLAPRTLVLTGDTQLRSRPIPALLEALRSLGAEIYSTKPDGSPPFVVFGEKLMGGRVKVNRRGARYLPALLLPCPHAERRVELLSEWGSVSHQLERAKEFMDKAGVKVKVGIKKLSIPTQPYRPFEACVPPDPIAALPFIAAAALIGPKIRIRDFSPRDDGAKVLFGVLDKVGISARVSPKGLTVEGPQRPKAASIDLSGKSEILPTMAVLACMARGRTEIGKAWEARGMKSDRISAMAKALRRMGAKVKETRDGLIIDGPSDLRGCEVDGCNDYAVVTALLVAGLFAKGQTVVKNGAEALRTSYSRFVSTFQKLGAEVGYA